MARARTAPPLLAPLDAASAALDDLCDLLARADALLGNPNAAASPPNAAESTVATASTNIASVHEDLREWVGLERRIAWASRLLLRESTRAPSPGRLRRAYERLFTRPRSQRLLIALCRCLEADSLLPAGVGDVASNAGAPSEDDGSTASPVAPALACLGLGLETRSGRWADPMAEADERAVFEALCDLAHAWLEAYVLLQSRLRHAFSEYASLAVRSPRTLIGLVKVVEIDENVRALASARASSPSANTAPQSPTSPASPASMVEAEGMVALLKSASHDESLFAHCMLGSIKDAIWHRVDAVVLQAMTEETHPEARTSVLDALIDDLAMHATSVAPCFPPRYNVGPTFCTFFSEHLAARLRRFIARVARGQQGGKGQQQGRPHVSALPSHASLSSPPPAEFAQIGADAQNLRVPFSNADILACIAWLYRFMAATVKHSLPDLYEDRTVDVLLEEGGMGSGGVGAGVGVQSGNDTMAAMSHTINGALQLEKPAFGTLYVRRAAGVLREWMDSILARDAEGIRRTAVAQAQAGEGPLTTPAPIDVFSVIHADLHNVFEAKVGDAALAVMSAEAIGENLLEHADRYEAVVISRLDRTNRGAGRPIHSSPSPPSPTSFWGMTSSGRLLQGQEEAREGREAREAREGGERRGGGGGGGEGEGVSEGFFEGCCTAANNCAVYTKEIRQTEKYVQEKVAMLVPRTKARRALANQSTPDLMVFRNLMKCAALKFDKVCAWRADPIPPLPLSPSLPPFPPFPPFFPLFPLFPLFPFFPLLPHPGSDNCALAALLTLFSALLFLTLPDAHANPHHWFL